MGHFAFMTFSKRHVFYARAKKQYKREEKIPMRIKTKTKTKKIYPEY